MFRTASTDRTVVEAVIEAADEHGRSRVAVEDPLSGTLTYKRLLHGDAHSGREAHAAGAGGQAGRRHAAQLRTARP